MQGRRRTGLTGFTIRKGNESGSAEGTIPGKVMFDSGFPEPSLM
jgi:hypothetical protein